MNFENARKGVRLLYIAAIFELIAAIIAGCGLLFSALGTAGVILTVVLAFVALVLEIIAFVQNLRGLNFAGKEEKYFKYAFWAIIGGIIFAVITAFFSGGGTLSVITQTVDGILDIASSILICLGIAKLFDSQGNREMVNMGTSTAMIFAIAFAVAQIIKLIVSVNSGSFGMALSVVLGIAVLVLDIVAYIKFLLYLKRASVEL